MNDLPQRYTALVARRQELEVVHPRYPALVLHHENGTWAWKCTNTGGVTYLAWMDWEGAKLHAESLIFRRLCEALPLGWVYGQCEGRSHPFGVFNMTGVGPECYVGPDPLSAIFAFWEAQ